MADTVHPNDNGYGKLANKWFTDGLVKVLPQADAGPDQDVDEKHLLLLTVPARMTLMAYFYIIGGSNSQQEPPSFYPIHRLRNRPLATLQSDQVARDLSSS